MVSLHMNRYEHRSCGDIVTLVTKMHGTRRSWTRQRWDKWVNRISRWTSHAEVDLSKGSSVSWVEMQQEATHFNRFTFKREWHLEPYAGRANYDRLDGRKRLLGMTYPRPSAKFQSVLLFQQPRKADYLLRSKWTFCTILTKKTNAANYLID